MAVNLSKPHNLLPVPGVRLAATSSGVKGDRDDFALAVFDPTAVVAGVYTQSAFAAPPVFVAKERGQTARAWLVNSGNANAATGEPGRQDAIELCDQAAAALQLEANALQPFSTGVIGERLAMDKLVAAIPSLVSSLEADNWLCFAAAIMTTDTVAKAVSEQLLIDGEAITVTGVAKGSGMIKPNMATMLGYIACNAIVSRQVLQKLATEVANASFNRITVDGDTSTNDCFMLVATGASAMTPIVSVSDPRLADLQQAVTSVARTLAQAIVRDGEGATKFVTVTVSGGASEAECLEVAYTVAESPLVKTALFAGDANWGRFCMAIGRAQIAGLDPSGVSLWLDEVEVAHQGLMSASYSEEAGASVLAKDEFEVRIDLGRGSCVETIWTTDLSYEYVRINAEYRS
jgi:glutamate N-acetyltransferase/amino-acid N-acetyltransferase